MTRPLDHEIEVVTERWKRRYADQVFRFALFAEFTVGEMLPGTYVYQRLQLAIALQRMVHVFRGEVRRMTWWLQGRGKVA